MEIRTCEEYVLSVLENTENELERVKEESESTILLLSEELERYRKAFEILDIKLERSYKNELHVECKGLWETLYPTELNEVISLLNLSIPEEVVPESEE